MALTLSRRALLLGSAAAAGGLMLPASGVLRASDAPAGTRHALLVAVTEYPYLPPNNALRGPNNDARLIRDYLLHSAPVAFQPENMTILADDFEGASGSPTLAVIRGAMAELALRVEPGDFVYLHFSGHGHQQPSRFPEREIDGLDEVFMPRDVGIMSREMREWPNGYVDKTIKEDLDAIRRNGAFVWAVFDCCHAGTMTRNILQANTDEVARMVDLAGMDIPADLWVGTSRGFGGTPRQTMLSEAMDATESAAPQADMGGLVAFYASQTIEPTFEMPLPQGAENAVQMGLFTFALLQQLGRNPRLTYRQLGEAVMHSYRGMNRIRPIPMFEGALDAPVFGVGTGGFLPEWRIIESDRGVEVTAGHIHQLTQGSQMAVLAAPNAPIEEALGLVEVASVAAMRSTLASLPPEETLSLGPDETALAGMDTADIPQNAYARVVSQAIEMELAVALPSAAGSHHGDAARISAMLEELASDETAPFRLRLVAANAPADLRLDVLSRADVIEMMRAQADPTEPDDPALATAGIDIGARLWLMDAAASLSLRTGFTPPSLDLARLDAQAQMDWLRDALTRVYRATNLSRLAGNTGLTDELLSVELYLKRDGGSAAPAQEVISTSSVPFVRPGDEVHMRIENRGRSEIDVHALFIGADYAIVPAAWPERLQPGNRLDEGLFGISDNSFGIERVVLAISERVGMAPVLDLGYLAQDGVQTRGLGGTRGAAGGLRELLMDVAEAPATRSAHALGGGRRREAQEAVLVYSLDVVPLG